MKNKYIFFQKGVLLTTYDLKLFKIHISKKLRHCEIANVCF